MRNGDFADLGQLPAGFSVRGPRPPMPPKLRRGLILVHEVVLTDHTLLHALATKTRRTSEEEQRLQALLRQIVRREPITGVAAVRDLPKVHPAIQLAGYLVAKKQGLVTKFPGSGSSRRRRRTPGPEPVAHMELSQQREVLRHFKEFFGVPIGRAWILPFLDNVERASIDAIGANHAAAPRGEPNKQEAQRAGLPLDPLKRSQRVMTRTLAEISTWPTTLEPPPWLDAPLVAYLIGRYGFDNGGGGRAISRKTMTRLLADPGRLARELRRAPNGRNRFRGTLELLEREGTQAARRR